MSSRDLATVVKTQKAFIKELLDRLERKEIVVSKPKLFFHDAPLDIDELNDCLNDSYFTGLNLQQIFELAKKSIRLTKDNCDMTHKLEDLLEKAKINGDNYYVNELKKVLVAEDF